MNKSELGRLSVLQKKLLKDGLRAHWRAPVDLACGSDEVGCFRLSLSGIEDRHQRAIRRAASARAAARLIKRGLVERTGWGRWRLTPRGLKVAKALWPLLKPYSKRELATTISRRDR